MFVTALLVGFCCGIVGVLVDLDHLIAFIIKRDAHDARIFHEPLFYTASFVFCGIIAYIGGLVLWSILTGGS